MVIGKTGLHAPAGGAQSLGAGRRQGEHADRRATRRSTPLGPDRGGLKAGRLRRPVGSRRQAVQVL
jgi:hypothetical protein